MKIFKLLIISYLFAVPLKSFADSPSLLATLRLNAPPTSSLVSTDEKTFATLLQAKDKQPYGLQIIDTSNNLHLKLMGFFPLNYGAIFYDLKALSTDGKTALVLANSEKQKFNEEINYEIIAVDLTEANKPKELWHRKSY